MALRLLPLLLLLLSCRRAEEVRPVAVAVAPSPSEAVAGEDAGPEPEWTARSPDGRWEARREAEGCRVTMRALQDGLSGWERDLCEVTRHQLVYAGNEGELLVLEPFPAFEEGALLRATLGVAYFEGQARPISAAAVFTDTSKLRLTARHYYWLQGVAGEDGKPPEQLPSGAVLVTLRNGERRQLGPKDQVSGEPPRVRRELPSLYQPLPEAALGPAPASSGPTGDEVEAQQWRRDFREAREAVRLAERELQTARNLEAPKLMSDKVQGGPGVSVPVGERNGCTVYSGWELVCDEENRRRIDDPRGRKAALWKQYQEQRNEAAFAPEREQRLKAAEQGLETARKTLEDLERKASLRGIPFEWRK